MTEEIKREFKGVWIPKEVYCNKELNWTDRILLTEINSLDGEQGCFASNAYFAKFLGVTENIISNSISKLKKMGFITQASFDGRRRILKTLLINREPDSLSVGNQTPCEQGGSLQLNRENNNTINNPINKTSNSILAEPEQKTQSSNIVNFREAAKPKKKTLNQLVEEYSQDVNIKSELNRYLAVRKEKKDYPAITQFEAMLENLRTLGDVNTQIKSIQQSIRSGYRDFYKLGFSNNSASSFDTAAGHAQTQDKPYKQLTPAERAEYNATGLGRNETTGELLKF